MPIVPVDIGLSPNDDNGDPLRTAYDKINNSFDQVASDIAQNLSIDPTLAELSPNAVANQAIFAEFVYISAIIKALQLTNVNQLPFVLSDYKRQQGTHVDGSTVVYDRDLISANIDSKEYFLIKTSLLSTSLYSNFFYKENLLLYIVVSSEDSERTTQRIFQFTGYVNTTIETVTALDVDYTAFLVSDQNFVSDGLAINTNGGYINISLVKDNLDLSPYQLLSDKGAANGYVPLNGSTLIDNVYLPSYVDDVLEFTDFASFPATGETGKIFVAIDTGFTYRWSGSLYIQIGGIDPDAIKSVELVLTDVNLSTLTAQQILPSLGVGLIYDVIAVSVGTNLTTGYAADSDYRITLGEVAIAETSTTKVDFTQTFKQFHKMDIIERADQLGAPQPPGSYFADSVLTFSPFSSTGATGGVGKIIISVSYKIIDLN